ncbi:MAG: BadF/BadG/BcrA/BcrD ATPase family protein [Gemmatimonadota bacterium]
MARFLAGADVGGTSTTVIVSNGERELGRAEGAGAAVRPGRALASAAMIAETVRSALAMAGTLRCSTLVIGAAGAGREIEREELRSALRQEGFADQIVVTTDIEIALAAAFGNDPGIVVTAGTGSVAVARDAHGRQHRSGGYGWQMGDEGSGYAIGRGALGAVSRAADARGPRTELTARILEFTRSENLDSLVRWTARAGVAEVAALAPTVLRTAAQGDTVASGIADYAARELAQLVQHLLQHFGDDERREVAVAFNGGLIAKDGLLAAALRAKLADEPRLRVLERPIDSASGAIAMALAHDNASRG